ncbi:MAG: hypothetical protein WC788_05825 [Candidatus Paceibacterota bacterium]
MDYNHEQICEQIFHRACGVLSLEGFKYKAKIVRAGDGYVRSYKLGYTNLKSKLVVIDIYTQKKKEPKKYSSILSVIAHELAHHQKMPYRQFYNFRWINRIHYPEFYEQVKKNIEKFKNDSQLRQFYEV